MESKIIVFCLRFDQHAKECLQHLLSRVRSGNLLSASLRACEIACNAPPSSVMTRDFCVGLVYLDEQATSGPPRHGLILTMAEIKLLAFFFNIFNLRGCASVAATCGTRRAHHFTHVKEMLLLPDKNYITWASSIPCSPVTTSCVNIGYFAHTSIRNQRTSEFLSLRRVQVR